MKNKMSMLVCFMVIHSSSMAVEYPNMIGTWQRVSRETVVGGTSAHPAKDVFEHSNGSNPPVWIIDLAPGKRIPC